MCYPDSHGLETVTLFKKSSADLQAWYKTQLRLIQGFPERTATEAVYLLAGAYPIEAHITAKSWVLPEKTATEAVYLLAGAYSIEAHIH